MHQLSRRVFRSRSKTRLSGVHALERKDSEASIASSVKEQDVIVEETAIAISQLTDEDLQVSGNPETNDADVESDAPAETKDKEKEGNTVVDVMMTPPLKESKSFMEKRLNWLETERVRLLQLSRNGSSRSLGSMKQRKRKSSIGSNQGSNLATSSVSWETAMKEFTVVLDLSAVDKENGSSGNAKEKSSFVAASGIRVAVENNKLYVREFVLDEHGNPGPLELSGHVGIDDVLVAIQGVKVTSLHDVDKNISKCLGQSEVRLDFNRKYVVQKSANRTMTIKELLLHIKELEEELKHARSEYARLDIGALESLQDALDDSRAQIKALQRELDEMKRKESHLEQKDRDMLRRLEDKERECRRLYNSLIDLKGAIRVFVRVRPCPTEEENVSALETSAAATGRDPKTNVLQYPEDRSIVLSDLECPNVPERSWEFDTVFPPTTSQVRVYREVEPLVYSAVDGFNACIFAYGQTGSGKTYTMDGPENDRGVYFRAAHTLYEAMEKRRREESGKGNKIDFIVKVSVLEVYQERVRDLLSPHLGEILDAETRGDDAAAASARSKIPHSLDISHHPKTGYVFVKDALELPVDSADGLQSLIEQGKKHRVVGVTNMNERSSRSHMVLIVSITSKLYKKGSETPATTLRSKLQLIDLAGSERARHVPTAQRLKETGSINKSLAALGDVMHALQSTDARHIPFRNSKLTSLLRDSLGGKAKTLMMIQISPARMNMNETIRTLEFAERVGKIRFGGSIRRMDESDQMVRLKRENIDLANDIQKYRQLVKETKDTLETERKEKLNLENAVKNLQSSLEVERASMRQHCERMEEEVLSLKKEQRDMLRKEKEESKRSQEVDMRRAQNEASVAQQELKLLRGRNTDLRRENQELQERIKSLEMQVYNKEKQENGGSARKPGLARFGSARLSNDDYSPSPRRFNSLRRMTTDEDADSSTPRSATGSFRKKPSLNRFPLNLS